MKPHIMVDLETMGTNSNSAIVSIGACKFTQFGISDQFYSKISLKSCADLKMHIDADTIIWWLKQSDEARKELVEGKDHILQALIEFSNWIGEIDGIWGNGASFDNVILSNAFGAVNLPTPWKFWQDRCYRTVKSFSQVEMKRIGTHHNALSDAISQAEHLIAIWNGGYK